MSKVHFAKSFTGPKGLILQKSLNPADFSAVLEATYRRTDIIQRTIGVGWESRSLTRGHWTQSNGLSIKRNRLHFASKVVKIVHIVTPNLG